MKIQVTHEVIKPPKVAFIRGHIYRHHPSNEIYISTIMDDDSCLVNLRDGFSFCPSFPDQYSDITDQVSLQDIKK